MPASRRRAHPRVGGENGFAGVQAWLWLGSSPRRRGKQRWFQSHGIGPGLIPAWAGKTSGLRHSPYSGQGSSPPGRGKPDWRRVRRVDNRLIPAWAGKTYRAIQGRFSGRAHPRVGGENVTVSVGLVCVRGSSPRGRGKRQARRNGPLICRLIPAWAGKTGGPDARPNPLEAHPRVGGENLIGVAADLSAQGSSPRGRGKPIAALVAIFVARLIPA